MKEIQAPSSKDEIKKSLQSVYADLSGKLHHLPLDHFNLRVGGKWSIAEHLQHLILSSKPIASALKVSKFKLLALGINVKTPKSYDALYQVYMEVLKGGQTAPSSFTPREKDIANKQVLIENWDMIGEKLVSRLDDWGETQLNRFQLPHPAIGKLSMREMMYFTIFHTQHHHKAIENILFLNDIAKAPKV